MLFSISSVLVLLVRTICEFYVLVWGVIGSSFFCVSVYSIVGKCHGFDRYIRVKKLASLGKKLGRTKNEPLFGRFVQQV